jgi:hypothetical protein
MVLRNAFGLRSTTDAPLALAVAQVTKEFSGFALPPRSRNGRDGFRCVDGIWQELKDGY